MHQRWLKDKMEAFRSQWRQDKEHEVNGVIKRLTFKQWLQHTKSDQQFLAIEIKNKEYRRLLDQGPDSYFVDTGHSPEVRSRIQAAQKRPRILSGSRIFDEEIRSDEHPVFDLGDGPIIVESDSDSDDYNSDDNEDIIATQLDETLTTMASSPTLPPLQNDSLKDLLPLPAALCPPQTSKKHQTRYKTIMQTIQDAKDR